MEARSLSFDGRRSPGRVRLVTGVFMGHRASHLWFALILLAAACGKDADGARELPPPTGPGARRGGG